MAASISVYDATGRKTGSLDLPDALFDVVTNVPLLHQVVTAQLAAARQGTHKAKKRSEVSGSNKKPFKQKGTGRARQGSTRAPHMKGGGIVHGPVPRDYAQRTPKKMIAAALLGSLSDRARNGRIAAVSSFGEGKTKDAAALLATIAPQQRVLVVTERGDEGSLRAVRNIAAVHVLAYDQLNAYDVLVSDDVIFTTGALEGFIASKSVAKQEVSA